MSVELSEQTASLGEFCEVADAEPLLAWLQAHPQGPIDVTRCAHVHTAVLQVLIAARPTLVGVPACDDERAWLAPLLYAVANTD